MPRNLRFSNKDHRALTFPRVRAVLGRGDAAGGLEHADEVAGGAVADTCRDVRDAEICRMQQVLRGLDAQRSEVIREIFPGMQLEIAAEVVFRHIDAGRGVGQRDVREVRQ